MTQGHLLPLLACWSTLFAASAAPAEPLQLLSVKKIWDGALHNAFTDLCRFNGTWYCTFREGERHVGGDGAIRVLTSTNAENWESAGILSEKGVDLRDPKFSVTPDSRLMLLMGGSLYEGNVLKERQPRVAFSRDGRNWTAPQLVAEKGDWLWRVTWHKGRAYGVTYGVAATPSPREEWTVRLLSSGDGLAWNLVTKLAVTSQPNETTVRFLAHDECVALVRREGSEPGLDKEAWIGHSAPPYTNWSWHSAGMQVGGPNFIVLPDGAMIASGRFHPPKPQAPRTFVGRMSLEALKPDLLLPSGGDCSYPGLVWHDGMLWVSYYSSHEGRTSIYLAKVRLPGQSP
jgi:hypothetical protein